MPSCARPRVRARRLYTVRARASWAARALALCKALTRTPSRPAAREPGSLTSATSRHAPDTRTVCPRGLERCLTLPTTTGASPADACVASRTCLHRLPRHPPGDQDQHAHPDGFACMHHLAKLHRVRAPFAIAACRSVDSGLLTLARGSSIKDALPRPQRQAVRAAAHHARDGRA